jgi:hypothetical protein
VKFGDALAIGAGIIIILLAATEVLARLSVRNGSFLRGVILGQDNRTSTSKTFIFVWTVLVSWALLSLLVAGQVLHQHKCATIMDLTAAVKACSHHHDKLGLLQIGWQRFVASGLTGSYLLLLGIPAAAGVAAKAITQSQVASSQITKPRATAPQDATIVARLSQVFSADDGTTDIGDFQYVVFNLVTAAYFVAHFIREPASGLPVIPDTLLGLTSVSAALYVAKKAVDRGKPVITGVFPYTLRAGETFTVTGTNLTADPAAPETASISISVNDRVAPNVAADPAIPNRLTAVVPEGAVPPDEKPPISGSVIVSNAYGALSDPFSVQCA